MHLSKVAAGEIVAGNHDHLSAVVCLCTVGSLDSICIIKCCKQDHGQHIVGVRQHDSDDIQHRSTRNIFVGLDFVFEWQSDVCGNHAIWLCSRSWWWCVGVRRYRWWPRWEAENTSLPGSLLRYGQEWQLGRERASTRHRNGVRTRERKAWPARRLRAANGVGRFRGMLLCDTLSCSTPLSWMSSVF